MNNALNPILKQAMRHLHETAIVDDQRRWRYLELLGGALHLAEKIEGITARDHVGVLLPTSGMFPMSLLAIWMAGKTAVPVNYLLNERERQYIIDDSDIDTLISVGPMLEFLGSRPKNVKIVELDKLSFEGIPPLRWPPQPRTSDIAVILYTSGTSGRPKGVMLTHGNLHADVIHSINHVGITHADTFLGVLPQFHSFGLTGLTLLPLFLGSKVVYTARFVPKKLVELIQKHRPEIFMGIPSMYNALMTVKTATAETFQSLRLAVSGGEPLPRSVYENFLQRFGIPICEGYGLTETSPIVSLNAPGKRRERSVGQLIPCCSTRIVDDAGNVVGPDEEGEILLSGPMIMAGYYKLPDMTRQVIDASGYFRTGDWGKVDRDGYLYITGRKKEMLIIAGENVFPREIEEVLNQHPTVKDSAVVGKQDDVRGELPVAFVELHEDAEFNEAELRAFCREQLPGFKVPREIIHIPALPRNPTGKILRRELLPMLQEQPA